MAAMNAISQGSLEPADRDWTTLLAAAGADLSLLGSAALVPFTVQKLSRPVLLWVNWMWIARHGVDTANSSVRQSIENWLLSTFAYCVYDPSVPEGFLEQRRLFWADRYGCGDGAGPHGGSGRVGTWASFQVKGVGPTPLAEGVTGDYAHGCLWLEEAIREAAFAEVVDAEFPHGAVPAVAIIGAGLERASSEARGEPRALLVRPAVMRPAHLERASLFASSVGREEVRLDVDRTKSAHHAFTGPPHVRAALGIGVASFDEFLGAAMDQVAYGQVHRMFHGGYFSSNMGLNGELHDFGSFRVLPDWRAWRATATSLPFGGEVAFLRAMASSFKFYHRKYGQGAGPGGDYAPQAMEQALHARRKAYFANIFAEVGEVYAETVAQILEQHFAAQQRANLESDPARPGWAFDDLMVAGNGYHGCSTEVISRIADALSSAVEAGAMTRASLPLVWRNAVRTLGSRPLAAREAAQGLIFHALGSSGVPTPEKAGQVMELLLCNSRRGWPLAFGEELIAQVVRADGAAALLHSAQGERMVMIEGSLQARSFLSFGQCVLSDAVPLRHGRGARVFAIFPVTNDPFEKFHVHSPRGDVLRVPAMVSAFAPFDVRESSVAGGPGPLR